MFLNHNFLPFVTCWFKSVSCFLFTFFISSRLFSGMVELFSLTMHVRLDTKKSTVSIFSRELGHICAGTLFAIRILSGYPVPNCMATPLLHHSLLVYIINIRSPLTAANCFAFTRWKN
jgi:hypothetical protein